jgi:hypothetical protein
MAKKPEKKAPVILYTCCKFGTKGMSKWCGKCEQSKNSQIGRGD